MSEVHDVQHANRKSADEYCQAYDGGPNESAAAIVYKAGKACGISQKVLLTVLQKEQHLLTATNPNDFQFKAAMGLSCPDDANCDPTYAGFFNQVYGAAKRYQYYLAARGIAIRRTMPDALNYIQIQSECQAAAAATSTSRTEATALLYIYTPVSAERRGARRRGPAKATPARHTATAISRLSTIRCSAIHETDISEKFR